VKIENFGGDFVYYLSTPHHPDVRIIVDYIDYIKPVFKRILFAFKYCRKGYLREIAL